MEMLDYIKAIQLKLVKQYGFSERPDARGIPQHVPDGEYPMTIGGKVDRVKVHNGFISCCNFD